MKSNFTYSILLFFIFTLLSSVSIDAQNSLGFNLGLSSYEGDLHCFEDSGLSFLNSSGLSFGAEYKKQFKKPFAASLAYQFARFQGSDSEFSAESSHPLRGYSFTNNLHEITGRLYLEPLRDKVFSPYVSAGLGFAVNNPNTLFDFDNQSTATQSLIMQDQDELAKVILAVPLSAGVNFRVSDRVSLGAEFGWRLGLSDYLDGVAASASGEYNDYFGTGALKLNYVLGQSDGKMKTPKYKKPDAVAPVQKVEKQPAPDNGGDMPAKPEVPTPQPKETKPVEPILEESTHPAPATEPAKVEVPATKPETPVVTEPVTTPAPPPPPPPVTTPKVDLDTDGDGFIDRLDNCPQLYSRSNNGCPSNAVTSDVNCGAEFGERIVNFQTSFADLSNADKATLNSVVDILSACRDKKLIIEGHTDSRGSELVNQELSEKRARSVKAYIASRGIDAKRIRIYGFGENAPIADNKTKEGQAINRRVVISFF